MEWDKAPDASPYTVRLQISVEDRRGILADVSSRIADINTNIHDVEATVDEDQRGSIRMTVEISDVKHLEKVMKSIKNVEGRAGGRTDDERELSRGSSSSAVLAEIGDERRFRPARRAAAAAAWIVARAGAGDGKYVAVDLVHRRELAHVRQIDGRLDDAGEGRAGGRRGPRRGSSAPDASARRCRRRRAGPVAGIEGNLAGQEQEVAGPDGLAVRADGAGRVGGRNWAVEHAPATGLRRP